MSETKHRSEPHGFCTLRQIMTDVSRNSVIRTDHGIHKTAVFLFHPSSANFFHFSADFCNESYFL